MLIRKLGKCLPLAASVIGLVATAIPLVAQNAGQGEASDRPWMNKSLSPDERADLVIEKMTRSPASA